jgi:hypothetical protein
LPAGTEPVSGVTAQVVPADDAYWTDQPATDTSAVLRLNSSMKSFR